MRSMLEVIRVFLHPPALDADNSEARRREAVAEALATTGLEHLRKTRREYDNRADSDRPKTLDDLENRIDEDEQRMREAFGQ